MVVDQHVIGVEFLLSGLSVGFDRAWVSADFRGVEKLRQTSSQIRVR